MIGRIFIYKLQNSIIKIFVDNLFKYNLIEILFLDFIFKQNEFYILSKSLYFSFGYFFTISLIYIFFYPVPIVILYERQWSSG